MVRRIASFILAVVLMTGQAYPQTIAWKLDKAHSSVKFSIAHLVISEVAGVFKDYDVTLTSAGADFTNATLGVTIKVASINTDNERRDGHLRSADFFDAEKYPEITFSSTGFEKTGKNTYKISGDLTIHGVTKPVVLEAVYKGEVKMGERTIVAFSASTEINRFDYGVAWNKTLDTGGLIAGDKVRIDLTYEGVRQQ